MLKKIFFTQYTLKIPPYSTEIVFHEKLIHRIQGEVFKQARKLESCLHQRSHKDTTGNPSAPKCMVHKMPSLRGI